MYQSIAEGARNVLVDYRNDKLGTLHCGQGCIDRRTERHIAKLVGRANLNHRHVAFDVTLAVKLRGLAEEHGNVVSQTFLHALTHVGTYEEGIVLEDTLKFGVDVRRSAFGVQVMDVDILQFARATSVAHGLDQTLRHIRHRTDVDMVARLDDFDGFLSRDCLILFLHFSRTYVS